MLKDRNPVMVNGYKNCSAALFKTYLLKKVKNKNFCDLVQGMGETPSFI